MDNSNVFNTIKELGQTNNKKDELKKYCIHNLETILKYLPRKVMSGDGGKILDFVLNGFSESSLFKQKVKVIEVVLQVMRKDSSSITHCGDIVSRICIELSKTPIDDVVRWCNDSIQSIVGDSDVNMIWRDILPECMSALSCHDSIKHCGSDLSSAEYKEQCIHTLCQCNWNESQLVQLTAMFTDLHLSRNDHKQVVNKICSYIVDLPPDSLPPLVHQLLKLCKLFDLEIVLAHLSHYFNTRLYSKLEPPPQDSESTTMDIDDIVQYSSAELSRCLSTCLFHITQGAADPEIVRRHVKSWPKTQLLRSPFILDLALALSDKGNDFRTVCLEVIRTAIERRLVDRSKSIECAWARSTIPPEVDVATVLKVLTTESANHRQLTVMGLIHLAFLLLSTLKTKTISQECWSLGKLLLVRLCKSQPETASYVLSQLRDSLHASSGNGQYADCLYVLCKLAPLSVERCSQLCTIIENIVTTCSDYRLGAAVIDGIHPLINYSIRTRDTVVMCCRKGLYSRESSHRCLALCGFLSVLQHMKISRNALSSSQSVCSDQYSAHSYLTQLTVDLHATQQGAHVTSKVRNEAMCLEVVSILRRCLVQDSVVKQLLYSKLFDSSKDKLSLHEAILELLLEHLSRYLPEQDGETRTPLLLNKCKKISGVNVVLIEPIGYLLYVVAQYIQPSLEDDLEDILSSQNPDTGSAYLRSKLNSILNQMCEESSKFLDINMDDTGLSDLTLESKEKCLIVQQTLQIHEALIAHQILQWTQLTSNAETTYKLFLNYQKLLDNTKSAPKSKKSNKAQNDTMKSQKSQKSQADKTKAPAKSTSFTKDKTGTFKQLQCLWDLKFCMRMLELLYSDNIVWSSLEQRNEIRGKRDFHHFSLRSIQSVLSDPHLDKIDVAKHLPNITSVIYKRCICRCRDLCLFDEQTALYSLELFRDCLNLLFLPQYSLKISSFLSVITGVPDLDAQDQIASILEQLFKTLSETAQDADEAQDGMSKKSGAVVCAVMSRLILVPTGISSELSSIILKIEDLVRTSQQDYLSLLPALLAASCRLQQEAALVDEIVNKLTEQLGRIDEEETSVGDTFPGFPSIDSRSGHTVLGYICTHLGLRYKCVEHLLSRARDLSSACGSYAVHGNQNRVDKELKELYRSIVLQMCQLTTSTSRIAKLRCTVGAGSEKVLASCVRLYSLLAALALQIDGSAAQAVRFDRLLKLSGKKLSSVLDNLITYLEASQQQQSASKILKDTKMIPRLVRDAERFHNYVTLLANKTKVDYQQYLSLGTARDFRIKAPILDEVLNAKENEDTEPNIDDSDTVVLSPVQSDAEEEEEKEDTNVRKRRRKS